MSQPDMVQQMIVCLEKSKDLSSKFSQEYLEKAKHSLTQIFYPDCSNLILHYLQEDLNFYQVKAWILLPKHECLFLSGYNKEEVLLKLHNEMLVLTNGHYSLL